MNPSRRLATIGEALVAITPDGPHGLEDTDLLRVCTGGAEANVAVGVARLGVPATWVGRLGDDPLGRRVASDLARAGVEVVAIPTERPTGLYLREWLPDGQRRPFYYRAGAAGTALTAADWPKGLDDVSWVHVTGITPALGPGPAAAVRAAIDWARGRGVTVSLDPNYRPALWSRAEAAAALRPLLKLVDVVLTGEDEVDVLFDTTSPAQAIDAALALGVRCCVVKLGARGALAGEGDARLEVSAAPALEVDPVGAGDAFDAGFVAGRLCGASLAASLELGAYCGARAVERATEHDGAVTVEELPPRLATLLLPDLGSGPTVPHRDP